jgi:hypothetical protein
VAFRLRPVLVAGLGAALLAGFVTAALPFLGPARATSDLEAAVQELVRRLPSERAVLSDDPMVAFLAGHPLAGRLIDTSLTRIWAGDISESTLQAAVGNETTDGIVLWRGTFRRYFPEVWPSAERSFARRTAFSGGRLLLLVRTRALAGRATRGRPAGGGR